MAFNNIKVLLGFQDEHILDKHSSVVNYTTNKIGGKPDWPLDTPKPPNCPLCQLPRPLILQIYAPLDNSQFHRTLYVFACINPNCWNQNESWLCLRSQILEQHSSENSKSANTLTLTDWCHDADDWGDDDNNANITEENGNFQQLQHQQQQQQHSDDEEESCSFEENVRVGLGHLTVDDRNANTGVADIQEIQGGGAYGRQNSPTASAEIEGDESEIVTIDTPNAPQYNIAALLQEVTPLPQELCHRAQTTNDALLQFQASFINVAEEIISGVAANGVSDHHIRDLLQEYQQNNEDAEQLMNNDDGPVMAQNDSALATLEKYEKSCPAHGDKMFHDFLTRIQMNPGQILRYGRNGTVPLLISPLQDIPRKCRHCQNDMIFELQILPTIIPKLRLQGVVEAGSGSGSRLEFGTVLVFTCSRSCWSSDSKIREEEIIVQMEKY